MIAGRPHFARDFYLERRAVLAIDERVHRRVERRTEQALVHETLSHRERAHRGQDGGERDGRAAAGRALDDAIRVHRGTPHVDAALGCDADEHHAADEVAFERARDLEAASLQLDHPRGDERNTRGLGIHDGEHIAARLDEIRVH